jgi:hypothetical protein
MPFSEKRQLPIHPLIADLTAESDDALAPVMFAGYVGDAGKTGRVRLYLTLKDLSQYIEFDEESILHATSTHAASAPAAAPLQDATFLWLRARSPVRAVRSKVMEARAISAAIAWGRRRHRRV